MQNAHFLHQQLEVSKSDTATDEVQRFCSAPSLLNRCLPSKFNSLS